MDAPSVLLLHGVQSGRTTWWRMEQDLTDLGARVVALDLAGHGGRPAAPAPLTLAGLADDVAARLTGPVDLVVGHSLGAIVALELARRHPDVARGLVLEDPPGLGADLDPAAVADEVERESPLARRDPEGLRSRILAAEPLWSAHDADHAVANRALLDEQAVAALLRTDPWDLTELVRRCTLPVLLLLADSPASALQGTVRDAVLSALPAGRVHAIRSGHGIHRDRPALWLHHVLGFAEHLTEEHR